MTRYAYWDYTLERRHFDVTVEDVDDEAVVLVRDGAYDVTGVITILAAIKPSSGASEGGISYCENGDSVALYDDGGANTLTLAVSVDGEVTLQRTAGALTYDVTLRLAWI